MPDINYLNANVNAGEISSQLAARPETEKFKTGAKLLENFLVKPYGSIHKRPGTEFIVMTKSSNKARLEGFRRSASENYVLEFTEGIIRLHSAGETAGPLEVDALTNTDIKNYAATLWLVTTAYVVGDIKFVPANNKFIICTRAHTSSAANEPEVGANWGDYWTYYTFEQDSLVYITVAGSRLIFRVLSDVSIDPGSHPVNSLNADYFYQMTSSGTNTAYIELKTSYTEDEIFDIQVCQINDVIFLAHANHHPKRISRYSDSDWRFEEVPFEYPPTVDRQFASPIQAQYDYDLWDNGQTVWAAATAYAVGDYVKKTTGTLGIYVCKLAHTSSAAGAGGNEPGVGATWTTYWDQVTYIVGDRIVNSSGILYTCHTAHTPKNSTTDALGQPGITSGSWTSYWNEGTASIRVGTWAANTNYVAGQKILLGKVIYECKQAHKSVAATSSRYGWIGGNNPPTGAVWTTYWKVSSGTQDLAGVKYKLVSSQDVFSSADAGINFQISIGAPKYYESIVISSGTTIGPSEPLFIQGAFLVTTNWLTGNAMIGTLILEKSDDGISWATIRQWTTVDLNEGNISYSGEADAVGSWYRVSAIRSSGGTSGRTMSIEPVNAILVLPFLVEEYIDSTEVKGHFILPNDQIPPANVIGVSTSDYRRPAFGPENGYPRTVTFHQSRVWWGGVDGEPSRIWGSKTEDFYVFLKGTTDTDGLDFMLSSTSTNKIMWLRSYNNKLVVGTEGEIFTVDAGQRDSTVTASNVNVERRVNYGCSSIPGILTGDSLLFFQRGKKRLREFAYSFERDSFNAPDMTLIAEQMQQDSFVQATFQSNLEPVLWCVTEKGGLVGFSYDREQNVTAWHRHITGDRVKYYNNDSDKDRFESVTSVYGGENQVDEIWFTVKRKFGNTYRYYIERFSTKMMNFIYGSSWASMDYTDLWQFTDCYKELTTRSYTTSSIYTGGSHLSGRTVLATRAGGTEIDDFTFTNGVFTVSGNDNNTLSAFNPTIGLQFNSLYIPTRFEVQLENGTSFGKKIRIHTAAFSTWRSYGGEFKTLDGVCPTPQYANENFELDLFEDREYTPIKYDQYIYAPSTDFPSLSYPASSVAGYPGDFEYSYTGQTQDNVVNSNHNQDINFILRHSDPKPFNLRGVVFGISVQ